MHYSLSRDEHAAMARYLSGIRKQLQDVCDLLCSRYGSNTSLTETAVKTLVSATLLEHELLSVDGRVADPLLEVKSNVVSRAS